MAAPRSSSPPPPPPSECPSSAGKVLSELTSGEKIDIKNKIYNLRKKLELIEIEKQTIADYPFKPEIYTDHYNIPYRDNGELLNYFEKSEYIRKAKMESLKKIIMEEEGITFQPKLNSKSKQIGRNDKATNSKNDGVFNRLYEKSKEYREKHQQRVEYAEQYDSSSGQKLYSPNLSHRGRNDKDVKTKQQPTVDTMNANEYLYQKALERDERLRRHRKEVNDNMKKNMNSKKTNRQSDLILKRKAEREVRELYDYIRRINHKSTDTEQSDSIGYEDMQHTITVLSTKSPALFPPHKQYVFAEQIWNVLDHEQIGTVQINTFLKIAMPFIMKNSATGAWEDIAVPASSNVSVATDASVSVTSLSVGKLVKAEEIHIFKLFIREMVKLQYYKSSSTNDKNYTNRRIVMTSDSEVPSFQPIINSNSKALAKAKYDKDIELIERYGILDEDAASTDTTIEQLTPTDLLYYRAAVANKKIEEKRNLKEEIESNDCTFHPRIHPYTPTKSNTNEDDNVSNNSNSPFHERLYYVKEVPPPPPDNDNEDLSDCTFKPSLNPAPQISHPIPIINAIKGADKEIERIRTVRIQHEQERQAEIYKNSKEGIEEGYRRNRALLLAEGPSAPLFIASKQREFEKLQNRPDQKPKLRIDIEFGPNKVIQLPIYDDDKADAVAHEFVKVYGLAAGAIPVLTAFIQRNIDVVNGENVPKVVDEVDNDDDSVYNASSNPFKL